MLAGGLGLAIKVQRIHSVGFSVIPFAPVKNQIRGKENERNVRRQFCQQFRDFDVHTPCQRGILLRIGDNGDGGAVNDELRLVFLKFAVNGVGIEQIKLFARQRPHAPVWGEFRRGLDKIISDQPVRAGDPSQRF